MTSQVDIYNMALSHIGISETVQSLEERSKSRVTCSRFWDIARDTLLCEFPWSFATKFQTLALIGTPPSNWQFQYQYPTDCLKAMYLVPDGPTFQPMTIRQRGKYITGFGEGGQIILSNVPNAQLAYLVRVLDEGRFPPLVVSALAWKLASLIAMPMTAQKALAESAGAAYTQAWQVAGAADQNEAQEDILDANIDYISGRY